VKFPTAVAATLQAWWDFWRITWLELNAVARTTSEAEARVPVLELENSLCDGEMCIGGFDHSRRQ